MLDVVIAVKEPLVRRGLEAALDEAPATRVVAVLEGSHAVEGVLARHRRGVVILDVRYRQADPDLLPTLARRFPEARFLVMVGHTADECAVRHLLDAGERARLSPEALCRVDECCLLSLRNEAHGCLPREAGAEEVVRAVEGVAAGEVVAAPWLSVVSRTRVGRDPLEQPGAITPRELDVMALLSRGLGNKAIARHLGIKEQTVKNHLARIMSKMGLSNRVQVGLAASRYHLRSVPEEV